LAEYPALDLRFAAGPATARLEALLYAALDDFEPIAIQEHETADGWLVFFREPGSRDAAGAAVSALDAAFSVTPIAVPDEDWARRSQANLTAVTVGRIVVAPPWDQLAASSRAPVGEHPDAPDATGPPSAAGSVVHSGAPAADHAPDRLLIVIDPSMGFGTGHHQTTRLCLGLLQSRDVAGQRVLDVGTGSGVLALAAWRLGAAAVVAMDNDPDALQNARENIDRNGAGREVLTVCADLRHFAAAPADLVTANLTAAVLAQHAAALRRLVKAGGALIISGFSPPELPALVAAFRASGVRHVVEGEWSAALIGID
jgi:ribosomal protein L11 methyltransferase